MGRPGTFDKERAREAGRKSKRRPYDQVMRDRLEEMVEQEIKRQDGSVEKRQMTRDEWYQFCLDRIILERGPGTVQAVREQRNRAYGQAKVEIKFKDDEDLALERKLTTAQLLVIEKMLEKNGK